MKFKVGDKVTPIEDSKYKIFPNVYKGKIYAVMHTKITPDGHEIVCVDLNKTKITHLDNEFYSHQFVSAEPELFHQQLEEIVKNV